MALEAQSEGSKRPSVKISEKAYEILTQARQEFEETFREQAPGYSVRVVAGKSGNVPTLKSTLDMILESWSEQNPDLRASITTTRTRQILAGDNRLPESSLPVEHVVQRDE